MPQDACWILQDSHIYRDHGGILFNYWAIMVRLGLEQFTQLAETPETPVGFFGGEPMLFI